MEKANSLGRPGYGWDARAVAGTTQMAVKCRPSGQLCFADSAVTAIVIDPLASNARAHKFYQRLGFKPVDRRRFGDDDCLVHQLKRDDWRAHFADDAAARPVGPGPAKRRPA